MKLHELAASAPGNDIKRLTMLKIMLQSGQKPEIANASYVRGHFSWGDLEKLGFAERDRNPTHSTGYDEWWTYTGPTPIVLVTQGSKTHDETRITMNPGDSTDPTEVDYS